MKLARLHIAALAALLGVCAQARAQGIVPTMGVRAAPGGERGSTPFLTGQTGIWFPTGTVPNFQKADGTQVSWGSGGGGGGSITGLKTAYQAGSTASDNRIPLTSTLGPVEIDDNATPVGPLLVIKDSARLNTYLQVNPNVISIPGGVIDATDGTAAGTCSVGHGLLRYNTTTKTWQKCTDGGSWGDLGAVTSVSAGSSAVSVTPTTGAVVVDLPAIGSAGSCGDASHSCGLTFNGTGGETARANVAIAIADSAITYASHAQNLVWATPNGSSGSPSFRAFVNADLDTTGVSATTYGDASHVFQGAVNAQGRITGASSIAIAIAEGAVTNLTTDLAAKATDSLVMHLAGTESATGLKNFTAGVTVSGAPLITGSGDGTGSTAVQPIRSPSTTGTNAAGMNQTIACGLGTGNAGSCYIAMQAAIGGGGSGTTAQTAGDVVRVTYSGTAPLIIVGSGEGSGTIVGATVRGPNASGTNVAPVDISYAASLGTGNAASAYVKLQAPIDGGGSGTSAQTLGTVFRVTFSGGNPLAIMGHGEAGGTAFPMLERGANLTGSNLTGGDWTIQAGLGTGTGTGGAIIYKYGAAGSTGTTQNTATESFRMLATGGVQLAAGISLTALTGAGGLDMHLGTGDFKPSTGAFNWSGASGKAGSIVSTGAAITITADAASTFSTSAGKLTVQGASGLDLLAPSGTINMGTGTASAINVGNTSSVTTEKGGSVLNRVSKSASYTATANDFYVGVTSTSSARVIDFPDAAPAGTVYCVKDESGAATATNTITVKGHSTSTVDGLSAGVVISTPYTSICIVSDGTNYFTY